MIKEIKYNGLTSVPSDYQSADGDLALSLNLINEDGALRPVMPPSVMFKVGVGERVVFIHKTATHTRYIISDADGNCRFLDENGSTPENNAVIGSYPGLAHVEAIGNTLVILAGDSMHYLLWNSDEQRYKPLGTHLPELPVSFGLTGEVIRGEDFTVSLSREYKGGYTFDENDDTDRADRDKLTEAVLAQVNSLVATEGANKGRFVYPFFVRYAYRLYDGSLTMHSAPVLMVTCSGPCPDVVVHSRNGNSLTAYVTFIAHSLDYGIIDDTAIAQLRQWSDIIKSVDIFISAPLYVYDQSGYCTGFTVATTDQRLMNRFTVCRPSNLTGTGASSLGSVYARIPVNIALSNSKATRLYYPARVALPLKSEETVTSELTGCASFYLLKSVPVEDIKYARMPRTKIDIPEDYLQSLVARERMTDDYGSHDRLSADVAMTYNSRLSIANIRRHLFSGFDSYSAFCYCNSSLELSSDGAWTTANHIDREYILVQVKRDGESFWVKSPVRTLPLSHNSPFSFLYYPDTAASRAIIVRQYTSEGQQIYGRQQSAYELALHPHDFLNGAFCYSSCGSELKSVPDSDIPQPSATPVISYPNKVYTSEVNNPYYFPLLGITTVGSGTIRALSTAARPLSQGQFGQFPLYAFTTEGIWALEISGTGTVAARQPITRDVCYPQSIAQIDSAVVFATQRGIMVINGSETQCISEPVNALYPSDIPQLPGADRINDLFNAGYDALALAPFPEYISGCRMLYDYPGQRIIVYNTGYRYAYIYSLKSHAWGMTVCDITAGVNSYPDALAMDSRGNLVNLSESDIRSQQRQLLVTRPLKFDLPDILKTVDTVLQRGYFHRGHVAAVLYGSRDLRNWSLIASSRDHCLRGFSGTPYKYFRIALVCTLERGDYIHGFTAQFLPRHTTAIL